MELDVYLSEDGDERVDLWVHLKPEGLLFFKNLNVNPVIYDGWFHVSHEMSPHPGHVDSSLPAADVTHVTVVRTTVKKESDANG